MAFAYTIDRILKLVGSGAECVGNCPDDVRNIASLTEAEAGDLSFLGNPKYRDQVAGSKASVLLLPMDFDGSPTDGQMWIKVDNPSFALALICRDIETGLLPRPTTGIHPTAHIEAGAEVDPTASVGAFCYIGPQAIVGPGVVLENHVSIGRAARVGEGSLLFPRVVVSDYCQIGPRNRLLQGCVIGADGYGYSFWKGPTNACHRSVMSSPRQMWISERIRRSTAPALARPTSAQAPRSTIRCRSRTTCASGSAVCWLPKWVSAVVPNWGTV